MLLQKLCWENLSTELFFLSYRDLYGENGVFSGKFRCYLRLAALIDMVEHIEN